MSTKSHNWKRIVGINIKVSTGPRSNEPGIAIAEILAERFVDASMEPRSNKHGILRAPVQLRLLEDASTGPRPDEHGITRVYRGYDKTRQPLQWSRAPMSTESGRVQVINFKEQSSTFASASLKMPSERAVRRDSDVHVHSANREILDGIFQLSLIVIEARMALASVNVEARFRRHRRIRASMEPCPDETESHNVLPRPSCARAGFNGAVLR
jgi:hypothetical protein